MQEKLPLLVDRHLIEILSTKLDSPLTTTKIRDIYCSRLPVQQKIDKSALRKYVYRELLRLETANVVERYLGSTGRGCKFRYLGEPEEKAFEDKPSPFISNAQDIETSSSLEDERTFNALKNELAQRKVELISSIGEAEEYQRLCNKFPALSKTVKPQFLQSRDRSSKLLGQLRAVENILAEIGFSV